MSRKKKIELLAPAGGMEELISAVENGADAVYLGGRRFNARARAKNFTDDDLQEAIDYAHKRNVAIHVTLNTLLREEELPAALEDAAFYYQAGVDALIIQDLGLARLIREFMPDLPLHLSTQGTVYDLAGVETAARLGFQRVVLARELTYDEIQEICQNTETEIEVFCHGALCVCYSGQCQLSRYFGGRSGNRGECAQPCRLPYETRDGSGKILPEPPYPLSPKDQCLADHLPDLIRAGVTSLKIEGRMKSADYVGIVTSIYRKYIDQYYETGTCNVTTEDRNALMQVFNRGGFTDGYFHGESGPSLMAGSIPKHQGIYIGTVKGRVKGTDLVDLELEGDLSMGDGIEIRSEEPVGNIVTYLEPVPTDPAETRTKSSRKSGHTAASKLVRAGDIRGRIRPRDPVYRISSREQLREIRKTYEGIETGSTGRNQRKTDACVRVIGTGSGIRMILTHDNGASAEVRKDGFAASDKGLDLARFEASLRKSGNTPFRIRDVQFDGDFSISMKASEMNALRREGLELLEKAMILRRPQPYFFYDPLIESKPLQAVEYYYLKMGSGWKEQFQKREHAGVPVVHVIPVRWFMEHYEEITSMDVQVIPYVSCVTRGMEGEYIEEHFEEIVQRCRDIGVYVGSLGWISIFRSAGVPVFGDYGLNVYNTQTEAALQMLGVRHIIPSLETCNDSNGAWPLMVMEHRLEGDRLVQSKWGKIRILHRDGSSQTLLVPEKGAAADFTAGRDGTGERTGEEVLPDRPGGCEAARIYIP